MSFEEAVIAVKRFRDERDWKKFHNLKDLAISINLEASELLELFQWSGQEVDLNNKKDEAASELADIMIYCIYFADKLNIDIDNAINEKISRNNERYPIEKAYGSSRKYSKL